MVKKIYHFFGKISNFLWKMDAMIEKISGAVAVAATVSENHKLFSFFRISFGIKAIGTLVRFEFEGNIM